MGKRIAGVFVGQVVLYLLAVFVTWDWAWPMMLSDYPPESRAFGVCIWALLSLAAWVLYLLGFEVDK